MNKLFRCATFVALSMAYVACTSDGDGDGSGAGSGSGTGSVVDNFPVSEAIESIPQPTLGMRWVLNETFSDEFNGTSLDAAKWRPSSVNWKGRYPGYFLEDNVSVADGTMQIKGSYLGAGSGYFTSAGEEYTIGCGSVTSYSQEAHYGYYECSFKANKTTLSTTFWLSTMGTSYDANGTQPSALPDGGKYSQELDICETIGRSGLLSGTSMSEGMNSNIHYWYNAPDAANTSYPTGGQKQVRPDGQIPSDCYNTYGCWWKNSGEATMYFNNNAGLNMPFTNSTIGSFKLPQKMGMNFVVETYGTDWIDEPTAEELEDPDKNVSYYDWVRSYTLEDVSDSSIVAPEMGQIFTNQISLDDVAVAVSYSGRVKFNVAYTAPKDGVIKMLICNENGETLTTSEAPAYAGYGYYTQTIAAPADNSNSNKYYVVVYLVENASTDVKDAYVGDSFSFMLI